MNIEGLIEAATAVRAYAYSPYSKFSVGAALLTSSGEIFVGCNVECVSFGITMCAEQGAVSSAVASGKMDFMAMVFMTNSRDLVLPCGRCRQLLAEFNENMMIVAATADGQRRDFPLSKLLPHSKHGLLEALKGFGHAQ